MAKGKGKNGGSSSEASKDRGIWFNVASGVSVHDGNPFVEVALGAEKSQMRPSKAREMAQMLYEGAIQAERDAATVDFLLEHADFGKVDSARFLMAIREHIEQFESLE